MALSNIFREPRREITESLLGTVAVMGLLFADYRFGMYIQSCMEMAGTQQPGYWHGFWIIGMFIGVLGILLAYPLLLLFPHFIGEKVCDLLARLGLELRPKQRHG